jgi:methylmalonyl-CoA mutase N-terminal domain/subunit
MATGEVGKVGVAVDTLRDFEVIYEAYTGEKEEENLIPYFIDCVKEYATVQEMCDVLREVFGEAQPMRI